MYKSIQTTFVGDGGYDNLMKSVKEGNAPFKYVDCLYIAFAELKPDSTPPQICYQSGYIPKVKEIIGTAVHQNPDLTILAQVNWAGSLAPLDTKEKIREFAESIPPFFAEFSREGYKLDGIDFDWERVPFTKELASYLFMQVKEQIGGDMFLSISPDTMDALDPSVVNKYVDFVNVQSYQRLFYIDDFINLGIKKDIIHVGICSENDDPNGFYPSGSGISDYCNKCIDAGVAGLYAWRIDNDDTDHEKNVPRYTITKQMWQFTRGTTASEIGGNVFDDTEIARDARGNPVRVVSPITEMLVRHGDVLNAVQTTNNGLILPQHGGYSGAEEHIRLENDDKIIEISGYTGTWYGWNCVLQLTVRTKKGQQYGPYGSMANSSDQKPFSIKAPTGQSIVTFKGTLVNVPLNDAPDTAVIASLDASFAEDTTMNITIDFTDSGLTIRNTGSRTASIPLDSGNSAFAFSNNTTVVPPEGKYWHVNMNAAEGGVTLGGDHGPVNMPAGSSVEFYSDNL